MESVTVFVFLLEKIPGFEIALNSTLQNEGSYTTSNFDRCNSDISNKIWHNLNQNRFKVNHNIDEKNIAFHKKSYPLVRNTVNKSELYENSKLNRNNNYENEINDFDNNYYENNIESGFFPKAPYLVAIFESVNNLTAQTCGGTLLSPHWVVTPAACLNVLANYKYINESNEKEYETHYSIVANAVNPVEDGTVHNVTEIVINLVYEIGPVKHPNQTSGNSSLALMKIEPVAVKIPFIKILQDKLKNDMDVRIYGWVLKKNSMFQASFTSKTLDSNSCKSSYSFPRKSIICLRVNESNKILISQMDSGGPALAVVNNTPRLVGVAQVDEASNLIVYLFAPHLDWITSVIRT